MQKMGFGFLRLPRSSADSGSDLDSALLNQMVDVFIAQGGRYFDTAYTYLDGASEKALRDAVVKRYPREQLHIANKLPVWKVQSHQECYSYFAEQLDRCGVTYFDSYLLHWLNKAHYEIAEAQDAFGFLQELKSSGKAHKIGFSYHDNAELLDQILREHPTIDVVQLQINYLDWDSAGVQSKACYEVACKHQKSVVVMEPVKGGTLADIPPAAMALLQSLRPDDSMALWALRFAKSLEQVDIVLSGMSTLAQMTENMRPTAPLNDRELAALWEAKAILAKQSAIPCTGCGYCTKSCPQGIDIPQCFRLYNEQQQKPSEQWKIAPSYYALAEKQGSAAHCIKCKRCEKNCPQKLDIPHWLEQVRKAFP